MLLEKTNREVTHGGHGRTVEAKIKSSRKLFDFFSDGVYSNKPVAICRELVANAIDSHVAAGKPTEPVRVTLPTELDPTFMVQDFGTGMTEDFIFERYLVYAEGSTKDTNNQAIGGFGIGKAAVFSYTDQFSLVSNVDGVKGVYSVFINDDGIPSITQVGATTTDEPNGVSISFPVETDDIKTFHEAAQTGLQYFQPLPMVINGNLDAPAYNYVGKGWMLRATSGELGVIMGGIRYPVANANLAATLRVHPKVSPLLTYGLDLIMPIGSCGVALSREALSYDSQTSEAIQAALESVITDVVATFANMFDKCPTMWDAIIALHKETSGASSNTGRGKLMASNAFWRGTKIEPGINVAHQMNIGTGWMIEPVSYRRRRSSTVGSAKWENLADQHTIYPGNISHVIVDDLPISGKSKQIMKIKAFAEDTDQDKHILVLRAVPNNTDQAAIKDMLTKIGTPTEVVFTSTLPEPPVAAPVQVVPGMQYVRPRVRMFTYSGGRDTNGSMITNLTPSYMKTNRVSEVEYAKQPATGILVAMTSFELPSDLRTMCETDLLKWDELFFVNQVDAVKIEKQFQKYTDVFEARKKAALAGYPQLPARLAVNNEFPSSLRRIMSEFVASGALTLTAAQKRRPFGRLAAIWMEYVAPLGGSQLKLQNYVTPAMPARMDLKALYKAFETEQWQAKLLLEILSLRGSQHLALLSENL
jgi:hypothetical protein